MPAAQEFPKPEAAPTEGRVPAAPVPERGAAPAATRFEGRVFVDEKPVGGGYRVVFRNLSEGSTLESGATSPDGIYLREVVLGQRYAVERVVGPSGASFLPRGRPTKPALEQGRAIVWDIKAYSGGE